MRVAIDIAPGQVRDSLIDDLRRWPHVMLVGPAGLTAVCPSKACGYRDPKRQSVSIEDFCPACGIEGLEAVDEAVDVVVAVDKDRLLEALRNGKAAIQLITDSREQRPFLDLERGFPGGKFGCCRVFPNAGESIAALVAVFSGDRSVHAPSWRPGNGHAGRVGHG